MNNNQTEFSELFNKYISNKLTSDEYSKFWKLMNEDTDEVLTNAELEKLWNDNKANNDIQTNTTFSKVNEYLLDNQDNSVEKPALKRKIGILKSLWKYRSVAAVIVMITISSILFFYNKNDNQKIVQTNKTVQPKHDLLPGVNKAVLKLADGSSIILDSTGKGVIANQGNVKIIKNQNGQLVYTVDGVVSNSILYNTLEIPRGGQYKIVLPDGSNVWLNAASKLKYPVQFVGSERRVEVSGEAYFEIAKNPLKPFKVQLEKMEVEVLGTHFNIKAYTDEDIIKTTLLEGKVKINTNSKTIQLIPGQQAQLKTSGNLKVLDNVDLEETVAWKEGNFHFENSDIYDVMNQISRWYDVDVVVKRPIKKQFIGNISRNVKLSQVLSMLEQTGEIKFSFEGKKVIVNP